MTTHRATQNGFTLIETMIVVALSVSMMTALGYLIYNFNAMSVYEQLSAQSSGSASAVMKEIGTLALPADAVLQSHAFAGGTYSSATSSLVLEIPSIDSSGNVIANTYDYAAFSTTSTRVYRLLEANALSARTSGTKLLSSTASSLTFIYNNTDFTKVSSTTVEVWTRATVKQSVLVDHRREQIRLRNF